MGKQKVSTCYLALYFGRGQAATCDGVLGLRRTSREVFSPLKRSLNDKNANRRQRIQRSINNHNRRHEKRRRQKTMRDKRIEEMTTKEKRR